MAKEKIVNEKIDALIAKARAAQAIAADFTQEQADEMAKIIGIRGYENREEIAKICVDDTGKGNIENKMAKMEKVCVNSWRFMKGKPSVGLVEEDKELCIRKFAKPVGVIACITPVTNPAATPFANAMSAFKGRNALIVCPHPGAKKSTAYAVDMMREELRIHGYPEDLIQIVPDNTIDDTNYLMANADLTVATGGPGMVKAAYSSGKPALGVGQGNVQSLIADDWEDLDGLLDILIAARILDFGVPCTGEQTVHINRKRWPEMRELYLKKGAYLIEDEETIQKMRDGLFVDGLINRAIVGQPPHIVARIAADLDIPEETRVIVIPVNKCGAEEPLAKEILCPVQRVFLYDKFEEAVERARTNLFLEGAGHSSDIWTFNDDYITLASERIPIGRMMVNQNASAGSGGPNTNGLDYTASLGCGYWGGNSIQENVSYKQMLNYTYESRIIPGSRELTPEEIFAD